MLLPQMLTEDNKGVHGRNVSPLSCGIGMKDFINCGHLVKFQTLKK